MSASLELLWRSDSPRALLDPPDLPRARASHAWMAAPLADPTGAP